VDAERAVVLEEDHPVAGAQPRGGTTVMGDLAAGDQDAHRDLRYRPGSWALARGKPAAPEDIQVVRSRDATNAAGGR
jgi:hypothetical protein